jgi:AbrB family looped-hinge helix DNA binding protein
MSEQGQIVIPEELQKALNIKPGEPLVAYIEEDRLILRPRQVVESELWAIFRDIEGSLSEELIQERRQEAQRESEP